MGLPPFIKDLLQKEAYPENPSEVTLRQTHISYLLFTPEFVYKIKKPVNFGFLDFTTLEKRLFYCNEELRLNNRLASGIYLDVVGVTLKDGCARIGGVGEAVEYAVKMKRLPEECVLSGMLDRGAVTEAMIERAARRIAAFHKEAGTNWYISGFGSIETISKNTEENFTQTYPYIGRTIMEGQYKNIKAYTESFLNENAALFHGRIKDGFIKDCHGDIHSEHVFITDGIHVIDCIEFNERFRFSDVVADLAFLSMDLDFHNRHDLTTILDREYFSASNDSYGKKLLDFYRCYRAYVRGKVEGFKADEPEVSEDDKKAAIIKARHHFHLASQYASTGFRPIAVIISGLSGTGKTTLSEGLSRHTGFIHLSSDRIRKELAGVPPDERRIERFKEGIYAEDFSERTYRTLIERGAAFLREGRSVILDATFLNRRYLDEAKAEFLKAGATEKEIHIIECASGDETVKKRLLKPECKRGASDAGWEVYLKQKEGYSDVHLPHLKVDTERRLNDVLMEVSGKIFG